jgi:RNA polymerase sigma factor (TIGR02999 family)
MPSGDVNELLERCRAGDAAALDELVTAVYAELRRLAAHHLRAERPDHTLQPTALVHEAYVRLAHGHDRPWQDRSHFLAAAAKVMRHVLVDHARARAAGKRAGQRTRLALDDALEVAARADVDLLALDDALHALAEVDPDLARVVELRAFVGLTIVEIAEVVGVSRATVEREWATARAWLRTELTRAEK